MRKILITGANGFIGKQLVRDLSADYSIIGTVRNQSAESSQQNIQISACNFNESTNWGVLLKGVECVIHCAARAHKMKDTAVDPYAEFYKTNTLSTINLAKQAAINGVKRFIFISSVKVNGELTTEKAFSNNDSIDISNPNLDDYGRSKYQAEQKIESIARQSDIQVITLRLPLVYGVGVKGNLDALVQTLSNNLPLPLGAITNKRSMLYVKNLSALIAKILTTEINDTYSIWMVSDNDDISTTELLQSMKQALNSRSWLIPIPQWLLKAMGKIIAKEKLLRLTSNLQINCEPTLNAFNWQPPYSARQGILDAFSSAQK